VQERLILTEKLDAADLPKPETAILRCLKNQPLKTWSFDTHNHVEIRIPPSSYVFLTIGLLLAS